MKNKKGITLIALVVTIIVLLILAGISIAMLTGENGILGNASKSKSSNAYYGAEEQMKLCYMAVRTEIAAQTVKNSSYDATANTNPTLLLNEVKKDLTIDGTSAGTMKTGWAASVSGSVITLTYTDSVIDAGSIEEGTPSKPKTDGSVV